MARKSRKIEKAAVSLIDLDIDSLIEAAEAEVEAVQLSKYGFVLPLSEADTLAEKFLGILETRIIPFATLEKVAIQAVPPDAGASVDEVKAKRQSFVDGLFARIRSGASFVGKKCTGGHRPEGITSDHLKLYVPRKREGNEGK